ncbi:hypothetical protein [Roseimaritima ulvae]|uniref:Uncharacterized protein n=1 Tax=Roseimaritima ulvae TaxID=980254 RepID=A0A5B9QQA7_9BACT|nr:hypothetical protein [Roseimaritima ulvae]QEG39695.1 hypothetical protein UC8_16910 [Roseimaritima ulvae]
MNTPSPDHDALPNPSPHPIERRLQRLQPQPLGLDAESIVAAAANLASEQNTADEPALRPLATATPSHPWPLVVVGLSGFAVGILLTYVVMSRSIETTAPVVANPPVPVGNVEPAAVPAAQPRPERASDTPPRPSLMGESPSAPSSHLLAEVSAPFHPASGQSWLAAKQIQFDTTRILAVRGSQPRTDLVGLSANRSRMQRQSTPILQPTRTRGMGIPTVATPNQLLDELLGPL